ncbi:hypothetical protein QBC34DRAFT_185322 [Podospora aff. communis PSN243]|uniref:Uncharacterized protein n=1 Tax=Podospora aff. communis PSN243 TaxID=3040156 RepID=A0AAV9G897_9PEZI|nr:hypothetical protein QBC34DRAFT_185322 [Podospora aff. communis PSN243]
MTDDRPNGRNATYLSACSAPFSVQLLERTDDDDAGALVSLLPASYRTDAGNASDDVAAPPRDIIACVAKELDLQRLDHIFGWLWIAGLPLPPRSLHQQGLLGREIIVAERMDMHLVWTTGRITVKPVPRFLLEPRFWAQAPRMPAGVPLATWF